MWLAVIFGMLSSCSLLLTVDMFSQNTHILTHTHILISWQYLWHLEYSENKCSCRHNHSQLCESFCIFCTCSLFVQINKAIACLVKGNPIMLKMYILSFSVLCRFLCKRSWKLKRSKPAPSEAPLSHRKHCSWNTSSVVPLYSVTLWHRSSCHHVTHLHNFRLAASLARGNWFSSAALMLLAVLGQACVGWPIRRNWVFRRGGLKGTGAKTERLQLQHGTAWEDQCVFWALVCVNIFYK